MASAKRIAYLEGKLPKGKDLEKKHQKTFEKQAQYLGNGVYSWAGVYSTDTRELFLMGILGIEGIKYRKN